MPKMEISTRDARLLINVINTELEITRVKVENTNDPLEKSYLLNLQSLRSDFEYHFLDQIDDKEE
tara:strand:- start:1137 stop:1331 length:195 start_codon:yes stop_codon:yes gene_type:complete